MYSDLACTIGITVGSGTFRGGLINNTVRVVPVLVDTHAHTQTHTRTSFLLCQIERTVFLIQYLFAVLCRENAVQVLLQTWILQINMRHCYPRSSHKVCMMHVRMCSKQAVYFHFFRGSHGNRRIFCCLLWVLSGVPRRSALAYGALNYRYYNPCNVPFVTGIPLHRVGQPQCS